MKKSVPLWIALLSLLLGGALITLSQPPAITGLSVTNKTLHVTFADGEIQTAPAVTGPWTGTGNTNGNYSDSIVGTNKYYRVSGQLPPTGRQTLNEPVTSRRYILYVPTDYNPTNAYPFIISSHGTSQNGDTEMDSTGPNNGYDRGTPTWPTLAQSNHVIVACPDMTGAYGETSCAISATHSNQLVSDEPVILGILKATTNVYHINPARILMTGFSGGGNVTHYVGLRHPGLFIGVCARHGNFNTSLVPAPLPAGITNVPFYLFTGSNDTVCGTADAITWYTAHNFAHLKTDLFTNAPDNIHTTDRQYAMSWLLSL